MAGVDDDWHSLWKKKNGLAKCFTKLFTKY